MSATIDTPRGLVRGVGITQTPDGLRMLKDPDCAAAVWQRTPLPEFQNWIDDLDPDLLPSTRVFLRPNTVQAAVTDICDIQGLQKSVHRQRLIEDIAALAQIFSSIITAPYIRLRLDRVTTNACRRFHIDAITARLVCTYRGTGTQLGTSQQDTDPTQIFTVPTGSPVLLRGTRWPEQPSAGLLHRSPPIEGSGETRLVLVIDPIFDPNEEV